MSGSASQWSQAGAVPPPPPPGHVDMEDDHDDDGSGGEELGSDAEGVWSPDIEQSFQEALAIYPPCGRRKIILSDEGKMYGRNELIARYIKLRTGKTRTRKQVSSHIQVLARRKAKEIQAQIKDPAGKDRMLQTLNSMSSAQIVSANHMQKTAPPHAPPPHSLAANPPFGSSAAAAAAAAQIVSASALHNKAALAAGLFHHHHHHQAAAAAAMSSAAAAASSSFSCSTSSSNQDHNQRDRALQTMASMSSAQIVSATAIHNKQGINNNNNTQQPVNNQPPPSSAPRTPSSNSSSFWQPGVAQDIKPYGAPGYELGAKSEMGPAWQGRSIAGPKLRLVEFSAFLEQQREAEQYHKHLFVHIGANNNYADPLLEAVDIRQIYDKFPDKKGGLKELYDKGPQASFFLVKFWADLSASVQDEGSFYGVTSLYESPDNMTIQCSTKVCSFGKQVVEKVETEFARYENGRFVYRIQRSPMCEYMINFIHKLKHLPEKYMMNSVLENFTILQVVTNRETQETLLCIAYVFEVSTSEHGAQHHIYKLVKD